MDSLREHIVSRYEASTCVSLISAGFQTVLLIFSATIIENKE
jgi:hypothetical protein